MIIVPNLSDVVLTQFLINLVREIDVDKKDMLSSVTGNRSLLLYSPSKYVFEVTVDDLGALTVTKVSG